MATKIVQLGWEYAQKCYDQNGNPRLWRELLQKKLNRIKASYVQCLDSYAGFDAKLAQLKDQQPAMCLCAQCCGWH